MSLLLDTSALIAARNAGDRNHPDTMEIMVHALHGEYGKVFVSDYIFDEAIPSTIPMSVSSLTTVCKDFTSTRPVSTSIAQIPMEACPHML